MKKIALVDGSNFAHISFSRAKSIIIKNKMEKNKVGKKEAAVTKEDYQAIEGMTYTVFFRKLHKYMKNFSDYKFIVCWDNPTSSDWRRTVYPEYKSGRDYVTDPIWLMFFNCMTEIKRCLEYYPILQFTIETLEADDIIYCLSKLYSGKNTIILSVDSDLIQICQNFGSRLYSPLKDKFTEIPKTYQYVLMKSIKGDKSDDIKGIKGYGKVKSQRLAEEIFSEKNSLDSLDKEQKEIIERNLSLIDISRCPNLKNFDLEEADINKINNVRLDKIKKFYFDKKLIDLLETFDSVTDILA
jgi:5'-3' exonuclease